MSLVREPKPRIGILSAGVWRKRNEVETLLGGKAVRLGRWLRPTVDLITGWGYKPTSEAARALADRRRLPYVALEDGFYRSVRPGEDAMTVGYVVDKTGIYYDSYGPSDLEAAIIDNLASQQEIERIHPVLGEIRRHRLSKYNTGKMLTATALGLPINRDIVLVVDQTRGDASVQGARADHVSFQSMLEAAISENPDRVIVVKVHPEVISGKKHGYLCEGTGEFDVKIISDDVNPWALIELSSRVYTVSSQLGFEGLIAGVPVTCFGQSFYSGWGLTDDRIETATRRTGKASLEVFASAALIDYCRYIDPSSGNPIEVENAIDMLVYMREQFSLGLS